MPYCVHCSKEIQSDWKVCPFCGKPNVLSQNMESNDSVKSDTILETGGYGQSISELPKGYEIEGRYRIDAKLGKGGFGTVYRAWDNNVDEYKALKVIDNIFYDDKRVIASLKKETKLLLKLNSKYVVRIFDVHLQGDVKFIDMEYIDGGDLVDLMLSYDDEKVPEDKVIEIAIQICQGMIDIHAHNIIHKDLKPQNVMLTKSGQVKIMDFGISETFRSSMSRMKETSKSGTPAYMSPEQLLGKDVGKESDIWSFGVMLYELLSGKQLYTGSSVNEVYFQIQNREYEVIDNVPDFMNSVLEKCVVQSFKDRFSDFETLSKSLSKQKSLKKSSFANYTSKTGIEMIAVEGGSFTLGKKGAFNTGSETEASVDDCFISTYQITISKWNEIIEDNLRKGKYINHPVTKVSFKEVVLFLNKLSELEGCQPCYTNINTNIQCDFGADGYRLPTESEWEFAAKGGNLRRGYKYSGSDKASEVAWCWPHSFKSITHVGRLKSNELGIYDMSGNVWEWCWDWFGDYPQQKLQNYKGPKFGSLKTVRGGDCINTAYSSRVINRSYMRPDAKTKLLGFRIARSRV